MTKEMSDSPLFRREALEAGKCRSELTGTALVSRRNGENDNGVRVPSLRYRYKFIEISQALALILALAGCTSCAAKDEITKTVTLRETVSESLSADSPHDRVADTSVNQPDILGPTLPNEILGIWKRHRILLVSEIHGTNESPLIVSELIHAAAQSSHVVLGLEFPKEDCVHITNYLHAIGEPVDAKMASKGSFWRRKNQDGRSSSAMLRLIADVKATRDAGMRVDIECFDSYESDPRLSNDESMASSIKQILANEHYTNTRFLFLTGNYHGRYSRDGSPQSMASFLKESNPFVMFISSIKPSSSWNCVDRVCDAHDFSPRKYLDVSTPSLLIHGDPKQTGFDSTLIIDRFSASPPLP